MFLSCAHGANLFMSAASCQKGCLKMLWEDLNLIARRVFHGGWETLYGEGLDELGLKFLKRQGFSGKPVGWSVEVWGGYCE